jgi:hypothetical protein
MLEKSKQIERLLERKTYYHAFESHQHSAVEAILEAFWTSKLHHSTDSFGMFHPRVSFRAREQLKDSFSTGIKINEWQFTS